MFSLRGFCEINNFDPGLHQCEGIDESTDLSFNTIRSPKIEKLEKLINRLHRGSHIAFEKGTNEYKEELKKSIPKLKSLDLTGKPLNCNCHLDWIKVNRASSISH
mgnify:CR=1 FL=1